MKIGNSLMLLLCATGFLSAMDDTANVQLAEAFDREREMALARAFAHLDADALARIKTTCDEVDQLVTVSKLRFVSYENQ